MAALRDRQKIAGHRILTDLSPMDAESLRPSHRSGLAKSAYASAS